MKPQLRILGVVAVVAAAVLCLRPAQAEKAAGTETSPTAPAQTSQQLQEKPDNRYSQLMDQSIKDHEKARGLLKRQEEPLAKSEVLLKRNEEIFDRYDKILATWERQQREYQQYLDTLPKKK